MCDVEWHPVDEAPKKGAEYWVKQSTRPRPIIGLWMFERWFYSYGHPMQCVTHWAPMEFPPPPKEA